MVARKKPTARTKQYGGATKEIQNAVGAGALDSPLYINVFSGRRRRRPLPRYRETVHFFSAKGLCEHNTGGASPSPTEIERDPLFVRRRMIVRTRIRTPHPSAFGCHLPPLGKAFAKCEHRLKPRDGANPLIHCRDRRPRLSTMRTNIWRHTKPHHIL